MSRSRKMTRGERNILWIEQNCRIPKGRHVGQPVQLRPWQRAILRGISATPTRRALVSFGRKNGKTSLSAMLLHLCGPEAGFTHEIASVAQPAR